ncbi:hypothetical protein BJ741DRAFT_599621 [Chytriomyces cf. hyalinus JEL632]|nr:hypothetical protein BJ741DRAFT_599621 [Chytriomyces cf. hyalinus JEL632]
MIAILVFIAAILPAFATHQANRTNASVTPTAPASLGQYCNLNMLPITPCLEELICVHDKCDWASNGTAQVSTKLNQYTNGAQLHHSATFWHSSKAVFVAFLFIVMSFSPI